VADVTDYAAVRRAAEAVRTYFGHCDHVVFAVGVGSGKFGLPFWNLEPADWEPVLRVNLIGAVNVAHAFAPMLVQAGAGTLLFISSVPGQIGSQTAPPYSAAKAGLGTFDNPLHDAGSNFQLSATSDSAIAFFFPFVKMPPPARKTSPRD
jgi:2-hydroxycyclohexanecarboxyl-CoA dehydrogenase